MPDLNEREAMALAGLNMVHNTHDDPAHGLAEFARVHVPKLIAAGYLERIWVLTDQGEAALKSYYGVKEE